ncbi:MAG: M23 family metallopeptidase [Tannerella sp.]|jgi:murein DD-endopeptidase MepM/ murein hydrolase activator NlpD|nr:M23 family metallopeptidase [Tannerella sp.]
MKYIITFFIVLLHIPVSGQPGNSPNRKSETETLTEKIYSIKEFRRIAGSLQMSVSELSDYPVVFPVKKPIISSGYGMRRHPIYKVKRFHKGIDFAAARGTPVYTTGNGIVIRKGYNSGYGNFIEIEHAGGFHSFYAHLSKMLVNKGDSVNITQQIACVGNTGVTTGSHLHYEIRKGKRFLNPTEWCYCLIEMLKDKF